MTNRIIKYRIIKFRAWDKSQNGMLNHDGLNYDFLNDKTNGWINRFTLMQFTGLKDKNGKEIYESDYLDNGCGNQWEVKWERLGEGENETDCFGWIVPQGLEEKWFVTGNKYEDKK